VKSPLRRAIGYTGRPGAEALRRDGYRCTICNVDISGCGKTRVDHIKPLKTHPDFALSHANLRSLCVTHDNQAYREKGAPMPPPSARSAL
jgi:5-methylcytosine-specific restriction endonuclease McrA